MIKEIIKSFFLYLTKYIKLERLLSLYLIFKYPYKKKNFENFKKNNLNLIFIHHHIPSCAGTSIFNFFCYNFGYKTILYEKTIKKIFKKNLSAEIEKNFYENLSRKHILISSHRSNELSYEKFNNRFEFTILRKPEEIYLSRYFYLKNYRKKKN